MNEDEMELSVTYPDLEALIEAEVAQPLGEGLLDPSWLIFPEIEPEWMELPEIESEWMQLPEMDRSWLQDIVQEVIQEHIRDIDMDWEH